MKRQDNAGFSLRICWLLLVAQTLAALGRADNIKIGPFSLNVGATAGVEYDDNINTSETNPKTEFSLVMGPFVTGTLELPVTLPGGQRLSMTTSLSYSY